jgi:hypothetical protein
LPPEVFAQAASTVTAATADANRATGARRVRALIRNLQDGAKLI